MSIVEAMALGVPCIWNNVGAVPEIIDDGKNGCLTGKVSADLIADSLRRVIQLNQENGLDALSREEKKTTRRFLI